MWNTIKKIALVIWQLPQDIVALVMYPFLGKKKVLEKRNGTTAYVAENMRGGISLGNFIYVSPYLSKRQVNLEHEFGHCHDSRTFGWLYLFVIGIPSLLWAAFKPREKCYYSFYTERRANKFGGVLVKEGSYGCYTYLPEDEKKPVKAEEPVEKKTEGPTLSDKINMISKQK